jgi:biopolymer transport protein ExbD
MKIKKKLKVPPSIPTASMADIAFLMIIFFLVSTTMKRDQGLGLTLPGFGQSIKIRKENICNIWINAQEKIALDGKPVSLGEIRPILKAKLAENDKLIISLKTDKQASYNVMIDVLDEIKLTEAKRISLASPE